MKIREVQVQNLRNFGPDAPAVSFVDPDTNHVRPLTILVGANGSGKTTLLEMIERMCCLLSDPDHDYDDYSRFELLIKSLKTATTSAITFELPNRTLNVLGYVRKPPASTALVIELREPVLWSVSPLSATLGGLMYFPSYRRFKRHEGSAISQPHTDDQLIYRYKSSSSWSGSLSELWVWQNYLDLESQQAGHPNLLPFVETIQAILGNDQTIKIQRGEVWIERPKKGDRVRLHELPSGEQQILVIFGEIIRRLRPHSIIMIDELEISLHPALQRLVLHHLRRLAQQHDLQVIVTTHSMEIVAAADPSEIVNLDDMVFTESAARPAEPAR
jgi:predicted ATP-dependent endonuclease of OLD family